MLSIAFIWYFNLFQSCVCLPVATLRPYSSKLAKSKLVVGELHDMLAEIEEEEPTGYIRFEKFLPMMTRILMERR